MTKRGQVNMATRRQGYRANVRHQDKANRGLGDKGTRGQGSGYRQAPSRLVAQSRCLPVSQSPERSPRGRGMADVLMEAVAVPRQAPGR